MTSFDYAVIVIVSLSVIVSVMRGLLKEVLAILGWVVAFYVAKTYSSQILPMMPVEIPTESLRMLASFLVLFVATLILSSLLAIALASIFKKMDLGWLNRSLGALFGLARGVLIVGIIVFLAGLTSIPQDARWRNAMFSAPLEALVVSAKPWVAGNMATYIKYD